MASVTQGKEGSSTDQRQPEILDIIRRPNASKSPIMPQIQPQYPWMLQLAQMQYQQQQQAWMLQWMQSQPNFDPRGKGGQKGRLNPIAAGNRSRQLENQPATRPSSKGGQKGPNRQRKIEWYNNKLNRIKGKKGGKNGAKGEEETQERVVSRSKSGNRRSRDKSRPRDHRRSVSRPRARTPSSDQERAGSSAHGGN